MRTRHKRFFIFIVRVVPDAEDIADLIDSDAHPGLFHPHADEIARSFIRIGGRGPAAPALRIQTGFAQIFYIFD